MFLCFPVEGKNMSQCSGVFSLLFSRIDFFIIINFINTGVSRCCVSNLVDMLCFL